MTEQLNTGAHHAIISEEGYDYIPKEVFPAGAYSLQVGTSLVDTGVHWFENAFCSLTVLRIALNGDHDVTRAMLDELIRAARDIAGWQDVVLAPPSSPAAPGAPTLADSHRPTPDEVAAFCAQEAAPAPAPEHGLEVAHTMGIRGCRHRVTCTCGSAYATAWLPRPQLDDTACLEQERRARAWGRAHLAGRL